MRHVVFLMTFLVVIAIGYAVDVRLGATLPLWIPVSLPALWSDGPLPVPAWVPVALVCGPMAYVWILARRVPGLGRCQKCGYDLTGNVSGRCPECGTEVGASRATSPDEPNSHKRS
jgi:hypothetical protein